MSAQKKKLAQKKKPAQKKKLAQKKQPAQKEQAVLSTKTPSRTKSSDDVYVLYKKAWSLLHQKKYERAKKQFTKLLETFPNETEVSSRARTFLRVCDKHLITQKKYSPGTPEECFDQGVFSHNAGQFDQALGHYSRALKLSKTNRDHILYAMAATSLSVGNTDDALKHLEKAIQINQENRFFAHNDPDFETLTADQEFQKLIFPE